MTLAKIQEIELMMNVGRSLALSQSPLGFIQSDGFNKSFCPPKGVENYIRHWKERALKYFKVPVKFLEDEKRVVFVDLLTTVYLESWGMVYVSTLEKEDTENYTGGSLTNKVYTLDKGIIQACTQEIGKNVLKGLEDAQKGLKLFIENGELPGILATYNQNMVFRFTNPRVKVNFTQGEYSVMPLPFVQGYIQGLKELMKEDLVVVDARTLKGNMREFSLTSNEKVIEDVYGFDPEVQEMFSILRSRFSVNYYNNFPVVIGLHNANFKIYDLGIPKVDYPQRHLNVLRIAKVNVLPQEETEKHLRVLRRYADIDFDKLVDVVEAIVSEWGNEARTKFLRDTISKLKESTGGSVGDSNITVVGRADFILKFRRTIDAYSTGYLRAVVDYVLEHPVEFNGFTGSKVRTADVLDKVDDVVADFPSIAVDDVVNPFLDVGDIDFTHFDVVDDV